MFLLFVVLLDRRSYKPRPEWRENLENDNRNFAESGCVCDSRIKNFHFWRTEDTVLRYCGIEIGTLNLANSSE